LNKFIHHLEHGGYLTAINDMAKYGSINQATLTTYSDWIRGDMLKHGKQEIYTQELLTLLIKKYTSQLTWNNLAQDLTISHPKTVIDYATQLELMDALFMQQALLYPSSFGFPLCWHRLSQQSCIIYTLLLLSPRRLAEKPKYSGLFVPTPKSHL